MYDILSRLKIKISDEEMKSLRKDKLSYEVLAYILPILCPPLAILGYMELADKAAKCYAMQNLSLDRLKEEILKEVQEETE